MAGRDRTCAARVSEELAATVCADVEPRCTDCGSGGATWLVAASGRSWTKPGGKLDDPWAGRSVTRSMPRSGWDAFDAPALITDWVFRNRPNLGALLRQETGQVRQPVRYYSDEGPVRWRPRLYVTYASGD